MKKLLSILILFAVCFSSRAQLITAIVTVTNTAGTSNGKTISVNGVLRTWTNNVTSANNQIAVTNSIGAAATNLFNAYIIYPAPNMTVQRSGTNGILLQSYNGFANVVALSSGWATVTYTTNTVTNMTVFRGFYNQVGPYEQTNTANGIVSYLSGAAVTSSIPYYAPALLNYASNTALISLTNFALSLSTNATNYASNAVYVASNSLNAKIIAATNGIGESAYHNNNYFQAGSANLTNWAAITTNSILSALGGLSYLVGNDIILNNPNSGSPITRIQADQAGDLKLNFEDGTKVFQADSSHNIQLFDHDGHSRIEIDYGGAETFRGFGNTDALTIGTGTGVLKAWTPLSEYQQRWPTVLIGSVTNYIADAPNVSTSETAVNQFNVPANTMTNIGDTLIETIGVSFSALGSFEVKVYFASDTIYDATFTVASTGTMIINAEITLDTTGSFRSMTTGIGEGTSQTVFSRLSSGNSIDFTTAQLCKVGLTGPASGNAKVILHNVRLAPSPKWSSLN